MTTQEDAERIAISLPGAEKDPGSFHFGVRGKGFIWVYLERPEPKKKRVPVPEVLAVRVPGDDVKQDMLAAEPDKYFTTDHYDGYPAVLVRLPRVTAEELEFLITQAWESVAPKALRITG